MPSLTRCALRTFGPLAFAIICLSAQAQTVKASRTSQDCKPDQHDPCPTETERPAHDTDAGSAPIPADTPVFVAGPQPVGATLNVFLGPLRVRHYGVSLAVDHALSSQWVIGALVNVSRGRAERTQDENFTSPPPIPPTSIVHSDTVVHTRSTSVAATFSYFTRDAFAIDGAVSVMRTQLDTHVVKDGPEEFSGDNVSHGVGLWLGVSRVWRVGSRALAPQLALEYVDTRTDPLVTERIVPAPPTPGTSITEQRQRTLAALLSSQLQQSVSTGFGTLTPYVRATLRERIWKKTNFVTSEDISSGTVLELDPDAAESRRSIALAVGAFAQFTHGISSFVDVAYRYGSNQLRETRVSLGLKFER